ncbi:MAG: PQQ-binding-like beta-propeller repeat protein, partial [Planctomycetota bacterium]
RLTAYDLTVSGDEVWQVDGSDNESAMAGSFFLGAPLVMGQLLYAIVEIKGEGEGAVYLAALDRDSGELQWRQQLANLETGIRLDPRRRMRSVSPSYEAGILVCPTGAGAVVGVDLEHRTLAWAYRYPSSDRPSLVNRRRGNAVSPSFASKWIDAATVVADGKVLLTPPESDQLHCIDLQTGAVVWRRPRQGLLYLASAQQGRALLIGNERATALRLADGKPAWKSGTLKWGRETQPAGVGFATEGRYYLPLTSAEVVAIDVESGEIVERTASRDGQALGNLICHRGAVISHDGASVSRYDDISSLRRASDARLATSPNDSEALRNLGEIAYNEGRLDEALALLESAYRNDPEDLDARDVLAECLTAALDGDFSAYRDRLSLLERL